MHIHNITAADLDRVFAFAQSMGYKESELSHGDLTDLHVALRQADFHTCEEEDR